MRIGIPKEIKDHENRVALPPEAVAELTAEGHTVQVAENAGLGSGFPDSAYRAVGAEVVPQSTAFAAELVLKVKEPQPAEIGRFSEGQVLFTFLHLAADRNLTASLLATGVTAIAYEAVQRADGSLPILIPMSQVAGALSVTVGASLLEKAHGGRGVLLCPVGDMAGDVTVIGAGVVGGYAARVAVGMGANVTVLDRDRGALERLTARFPAITTRLSTPQAVADAVAGCDLLVGAVLVPGSQAPKLVTRTMVRAMRPGGVIVDVAIDQGGCVEGIRTTSHTNPSYLQDGVVHCGIPNLPGVVPLTATRALARATLPYIKALAGAGWRAACSENPALRAGLRMTNGKMAHQGIAEMFDLPYNAGFRE